MGLQEFYYWTILGQYRDFTKMYGLNVCFRFPSFFFLEKLIQVGAIRSPQIIHSEKIPR